MPQLITEDLAILDLEAADRHAATRALGERLAAAGRVAAREAFLDAVRKREEQMAPGLPGGIGIPHALRAAVTEPTLGFARSSSGVDFGAEDGPVHLIFLIAAPAEGGDEHLKRLAALARWQLRRAFPQSLLDAAKPV